MTAEQMVAAQKAHVEALFSLGKKSFEGFKKVVELNVQTAETSMSDASEAMQALLSAKDAQEALAVYSKLMEPVAEKLASYSRHGYDIYTATSGEVGKVVEEQSAEMQRKYMAVVDTAVKNAPAGSENAVALMKSAVAAANNAFETVQKAAKQAADVAEANFQAVTNTAVKASQQAAARASSSASTAKRAA
jgi:phasin family protein